MAITLMPVLRAYDGSEYYYLTNLTHKEAGRLSALPPDEDGDDPPILTIEVSGERPMFVPVEMDSPYMDFMPSEEGQEPMGFLQFTSETDLTIVSGHHLLDNPDRSGEEGIHSIPAMMVRKSAPSEKDE